MSNKIRECYEDVFNYIHKNVMDLNCASFTTDYETAMRSALYKLFPHVKQFACFFHFTQAVKKNAYKTYGLVELIRTNQLARSVYYRLQCIPLLPPAHIVNMFNQLRAEAYEIDRATFRPFLKYYNNQWIVRVCMPIALVMYFEYVFIYRIFVINLI